MVDAARSLPGDVRPAPAYRLATAVGVDAADVDPTALRRRLGGLLEALASRLEPALQQAVQRALVARGVDPKGVAVEARGDALVDGDPTSPEGRALQRRVKFRFQRVAER